VVRIHSCPLSKKARQPSIYQGWRVFLLAKYVSGQARPKFVQYLSSKTQQMSKRKTAKKPPRITANTTTEWHAQNPGPKIVVWSDPTDPAVREGTFSISTPSLSKAEFNASRFFDIKGVVGATWADGISTVTFGDERMAWPEVFYGTEPIIRKFRAAEKLRANLEKLGDSSGPEI
jgi:hypothetical protein